MEIPPTQNRVLLLAFCCHPNGSMEERNGWNRALLAARHHHVTVLYLPMGDSSQLLKSVPPEYQGRLEFLPIELGRFSQHLLKRELTFYAGYRAWHRKAYEKARDLHAVNPFRLAHLVTLCGFREPGFAWRLGIPFLWGPLGGTHSFPTPFLSLLGLQDRLREILRTAVNHYQLHWSKKIRRVAQSSAAVIAATSNAKKDLENAFGIPILRDLETGLDYHASPPRESRQPNSPMNILWAGRLRAWKGFPILLHALAKLPKHINVRVRVLGIGKCKKSWIKLATQLKVDHLLEWVPWPTYRETLAHYDWAHVFAFTSLRDTSGTGLVEALSSGCPVLTVDHQGANDIVDAHCGILVSVDSLETTIQGFVDGLTALYQDTPYWHRLSDGARDRANQLHWDQRSEWTRQLYAHAIADSVATHQEVSVSPSAFLHPESLVTNPRNSAASGLKLVTLSEVER
jgi:glycosyltransferase involved in cell wall biosynthesis